MYLRMLLGYSNGAVTCIVFGGGCERAVGVWMYLELLMPVWDWITDGWVGGCGWAVDELMYVCTRMYVWVSEQVYGWVGVWYIVLL